MENTFAKAMRIESTKTYTENGDVTYNTTLNPVLDYFAICGALRGQQNDRIIDLFNKAWNVNNLLAVKTLFYSRDVRGGEGERSTFKVVLPTLFDKLDKVQAEKMLRLIPEYGRYDDMLILLDAEHEDLVFDFIKETLEKDLVSEYPSLLAKWLPSENTSSKETRIQARKIINALGYRASKYRKILTQLRKKINIIENTLREGKYDEIDYSKIPSKALAKYIKAFFKHDEERFKEYLEKVNNGESKINTGALFPYDILKKLERRSSDDEVKAIQTMWDNLPNYIPENSRDVLVVPDMSGSMEFENDALAKYVAMSLAIYYAERNKVFKNLVAVFATTPGIVELGDGDLLSKYQRLIHSRVGYSTNVQALFDMILKIAMSNNLTQEQMPHKVVMISDMEFNRANEYNQRTRANGIGDSGVFSILEQQYRECGYELPRLVFWNVNARENHYPVTPSDKVQLVSGGSPAKFTQVLQDLSATDLMLDILNSDRYSQIEV